MADNKKALTGESNINNNFIVPQNLTAQNVLDNMPVVLKDIMQLFQKKHINVSFNCLLNVRLVKTAQMITAKRVTLKEVEKINRPNWYALLLVSSGTGKDLASDDLDNIIFKNFRLWFKEQAEKYFQEEVNKLETELQELFKDDKSETQKLRFLKEATKEIRPVVIEMNSGTQEGFYEDAKVFKNAKFGSLFLKITELGNYFKTMNIDSLQFFNCLYDAYDGKVASKCTKHSKREQNIENLPVNTLLYSDYMKFKSDNKIESEFLDAMNTGFSRRSVLSFQPHKDLLNAVQTHEESKTFYKQAELLNIRLFSTFLNIQSGACYILQPGTKDNILNTYCLYIIELFNKTDDELLKREIKSRELKALKLSCLYAALNHPTEHIINDTDMIQAITTIQALSADLKTFINYKPLKVDKYDRFYEFFKENSNTKYTKGQLIKKFQSLGLSRRNATKEFDEIIGTIKEFALIDEYTLVEEKINNNSGTTYYLHNQNKQLNNKIIPLENLIKKT